MVFTSSPLLLDHADRVVLVHEGEVAAVGVHRELLHSEPRYRAVVTRETDEEAASAALLERRTPGTTGSGDDDSKNWKKSRRPHDRRGATGLRPGGPDDGEHPARRRPRDRTRLRGRTVPTAPPGLPAAHHRQHGRRRRLDGRPLSARARSSSGVSDGTAAARELHLERTIALFVVALVVQAVFVRQVRLRGAMLGERMLADLREDFLVRSVGLPPGVLERAGTGDLLSRITTDIDRLANAMREAVPQLAIGVVWVALLLGGLAVTAPPLAPAVLVAVPLLVVGCRWYFKRAPSAYRSEAAGYAAVAAVLAETVDAGRTIEAHRLGDAPHRPVGPAGQGVDGLGALHALAALGALPGHQRHPCDGPRARS